MKNSMSEANQRLFFGPLLQTNEAGSGNLCTMATARYWTHGELYRAGGVAWGRGAWSAVEDVPV